MQDGIDSVGYHKCVLQTKEPMNRWKQILMGALALPVALSAQELSDAAKVEFFDQKVYGILKEN